VLYETVLQLILDFVNREKCYMILVCLVTFTTVDNYLSRKSRILTLAFDNPLNVFIIAEGSKEFVSRSG